MTNRAEGFIGELDKSPYQKVGDKFEIKSSGSPVFMALKQITDKGHNPGTWNSGDKYDGKISYNLGYTSGSPFVMSVTNRDLYDEGWTPSVILLAREDGRINQPLDSQTKDHIERFTKTSKFLVPSGDKILINYLDSIGANYEIDGKPKQISSIASDINADSSHNVTISDKPQKLDFGRRTFGKYEANLIAGEQAVGSIDGYDFDTEFLNRIDAIF
jgi:hypothetical protein